MSWPSTDFEVEIQDELDRLREFKEKCVEWSKRPEASREAVLDELRTMAYEWEKSADDQETKDDAETLRVLVKVLKHIEKNAGS